MIYLGTKDQNSQVQKEGNMEWKEQSRKVARIKEIKEWEKHDDKRPNMGKNDMYSVYQKNKRYIQFNCDILWNTCSVNLILMQHHNNASQRRKLQDKDNKPSLALLAKKFRSLAKMVLVTK